MWGAAAADYLSVCRFAQRILLSSAPGSQQEFAGLYAPVARPRARLVTESKQQQPRHVVNAARCTAAKRGANRYYGSLL